MDKIQLVNKVKEGMDKTISSLQADLQKVRTGRASTSLLDDVRVDSYGTLMPLSKVATLATPEARLITVNPFDKGMLPIVEKAILTSGLGLTPNNDGKVIRIPIPALSEDRRKEMAKQQKLLKKNLVGLKMKLNVQMKKFKNLQILMLKKLMNFVP